jgi:hypothetical protein
MRLATAHLLLLAPAAGRQSIEHMLRLDLAATDSRHGGAHIHEVSTHMAFASLWL